MLNSPTNSAHALEVLSQAASPEYDSLQPMKCSPSLLREVPLWSVTLGSWHVVNMTTRRRPGVWDDVVARTRQEIRREMYGPFREGSGQCRAWQGQPQQSRFCQVWILTR